MELLKRAQAVLIELTQNEYVIYSSDDPWQSYKCIYCDERHSEDCIILLAQAIIQEIENVQSL